MQLVFLDQARKVRVSAFAFLLIAAALYFSAGYIFVSFTHDTTKPLGTLLLLASSGIALGGLMGHLLHQKANSPAPSEWRSSHIVVDRSELVLALSALALFGAACSFYLLAPSGYLLMDKVERSPALRELYAVRILFFMSPAVYYVGLMRSNVVRSSLLKTYYATYLVLYGFAALVEINREMLLILGVLVLCWLGRFRQSFPRFFPAQFLLLAAGLVFFLTIKALLYPLFFASSFEGGLLSIGELVNWARWTMHAFRTEVDLSVLHRHDLEYLLNAVVFPVSGFESASAIWFREILSLEGVGQTYGYSGLLSWYALGGPIGVFAFPFVLGFIAMALDRSSSAYSAIAGFCFTLVLFRFFRSEYVLVLKTFLWQYFYPALFFYVLSRIRLPALRRSNELLHG